MPTPAYWSYLQLPTLLGLQAGFEADEDLVSSDELHFIVVHQTQELWFKLLLRELRLARDHMAAPDVPEEHVPYVVHHLRRCRLILTQCAETFTIMETLTTQDFLAFRDKLIPASGFQSFQMREMEVLLGLKDERRTETPAGLGQPLEAIRKLGRDSEGGQHAIEAIDRAEGEGTFRDALHAWLHRTPIQGSSPGDPEDEATVTSFLEQYLEAGRARGARTRERLVSTGVAEEQAAAERFDAQAQRARSFLLAEDSPKEERDRVRRIRAAILFIESYRDLPLLAWPRMLLDTVVELEGALLRFRFRHARMVERVIGRRVGTGGSSGVDYLDRTTKYRIFTELWAVRTELLSRSEVPELQAAQRYGFAR